jgi:hypothetical protein
MGHWTDWDTSCAATADTCPSGKQTSEYVITQPALLGGAECEASHGTRREQACDTAPTVCPEKIDIEMTINETEESFTETIVGENGQETSKLEQMRQEIATELGVAVELVRITIGQTANAVQTSAPSPASRRLSESSELLITVTIETLPATLTEKIAVLESEDFVQAVEEKVGITPVVEQVKPGHGSSICATCKWVPKGGTKYPAYNGTDEGSIVIQHMTNAQNTNEKSLQHKCYHDGSKCTCKCRAAKRWVDSENWDQWSNAEWTADGAFGHSVGPGVLANGRLGEGPNSAVPGLWGTAGHTGTYDDYQPSDFKPAWNGINRGN